MDIGSNITKVIKQSQPVFKGGRFTVYATDVATSQGSSKRKEFIAHPGAVVILPIIDQERIVMIKNERFAVGQELWELPAGTLEPDELPEQTAYRELIEETGYQASKVVPLTKFYTTPGICNEVMHAYVAEDLQEVGQALEEGEKITVEIVTWQAVFEKIRKGEICDGKTLTTLLLYKFI